MSDSLVIIPARAGSKGVPGKNWKLLNGKPLIQYTLEIALEVFKVEEICVTTDATEVIEIAEGLGIDVPFVRPKQLASDVASSQDVILHALDYWVKNKFKPSRVVLLQPTSPFRKKKHIDEAISLYSKSIDIVVGVKETSSNPYYVLREEDENGFLVPSKKGNFTRRQDCPKVYEVNGAIYIINPESLRKDSLQSFRKIIKYEMDDISSHDIDNPLDWEVAETILKSLK